MVLTSPSAGPSGAKPNFFLQVLGDFETPKGFYLPLWRSMPHRVSAPEDVIDAHAFDERAKNAGAKFGCAHRTICKHTSEFRIHITSHCASREFRLILLSREFTLIFQIP